MGQWKRDIEDEEHRRGVATGILIEAGVLDACTIHEDIILERHGDVQDAYRLGNYLYTALEEDEGRTEETKKADPSVGCFESRRQMTDTIKEVNELWYPMECPMCEKA